MFTPVYYKVCVKVKVLKLFGNENCNTYLIKLIFSERGNTGTWMIYKLIDIVRIQIIRWSKYRMKFGKERSSRLYFKKCSVTMTTNRNYRIKDV